MVSWDERGDTLKQVVANAQPTDRLGISIKLAGKIGNHKCPSCGKHLTWEEMSEYRCGQHRDFAH
jgi:predicted RNA-binding Zn-ribbon protein involved in translation (DUF1610 family)